MSFVLRYPTEEIVAEVARRMRAEDVAEVQKILGMTPRQALDFSLHRSMTDAWAIYLDGEVAGIFGVVVETDKVSVPWLLTTDTVDRKPIAFFRMCRTLMPLLRHDGLLVNVIDARYEKALRWAARLGFNIEPEKNGMCRITMEGC